MAKEITVRRSWTELENSMIANYLLETVRAGKNIEKPTAIAYYKKAHERLNFDDCTHVQVLNQARNLKKKYSKTVEWRDNTGQGVLEKDGPAALKGILRCKLTNASAVLFLILISSNTHHKVSTIRSVGRSVRNQSQCEAPVSY